MYSIVAVKCVEGRWCGEERNQLEEKSSKERPKSSLWLVCWQLLSLGRTILSDKFNSCIQDETTLTFILGDGYLFH